MKKRNDSILSKQNELLENPDFSLQLEELFRRQFFTMGDNSFHRAKFDYLDIQNPASYSVYKTTNEKNHNLFKHINVNGGKVLTVGSSGDQAFNAILNGAKEVTIIDLNIFTEYFVELKKALIKNLDIQSFNDYFYNFEENFFKEHQIYSKISHDLSKNVRQFWDTLMIEGNQQLLGEMFQIKKDNDQSDNFYTEEKIYNALQKKIKENKFKLDFIIEDISNFADRVSEKYDLIMLSNIMGYLLYQKDGEKSFLETVKKLYNNNLNKGGVIQLNSAGRSFFTKSSNKYWTSNFKIDSPRSKFFTLKDCGCGMKNYGLYVKKRGFSRLKKEKKEREME